MTFLFQKKSKLIMKNWEKSMRMRMKEMQTNCIKDLLWQRSLKLWLNLHILVIIDVSSEIMTAKKKIEINSVLLKLLESNWLKKSARLFNPYSNREY